MPHSYGYMAFGDLACVKYGRVKIPTACIHLPGHTQHLVREASCVIHCLGNLLRHSSASLLTCVLAGLSSLLQCFPLMPVIKVP